MPCKATAPINVPSAVNQKCTVKCNFEYNFGLSSCSVTTEENYLDIMCYDGKNTIKSDMLSGSLTVTGTKLYAPSLNSYNGFKADAELIIILNGGGKSLSRSNEGRRWKRGFINAPKTALFSYQALNDHYRKSCKFRSDAQLLYLVTWLSNSWGHNHLLGYDLGLYESDSYKILGLEMLGLTPRKRFLGLGPLSYTNPYIK